MDFKSALGYKSSADIRKEAQRSVWYERRHADLLSNAMVENAQYKQVLAVAATGTALIWGWILLSK